MAKLPKIVQGIDKSSSAIDKKRKEVEDNWVIKQVSVQDKEKQRHNLTLVNWAEIKEKVVSKGQEI